MRRSTRVLQRRLQHGVERLAHLRFEPLVHFLFGPEVAVAVLHPLEVRAWSRRRCWPGCPARRTRRARAGARARPAWSGRWRLRRRSWRLMPGAFSIVIWFSSAAGIRTSTSSANSSSLVERLAAGKAVDRLVLLHVVGQLRDVEAVRVVDAALPVGDGDDPRADLGEQLARRSIRRCRSPGPRRWRP